MTAGILPLDGEMELDAGRYPPDRMFVTRRCASEPAAGVDALASSAPSSFGGRSVPLWPRRDVHQPL